MVQYGTTALIWACRKGHYEVIQMLINAGANCNAVGTVSDVVSQIIILQLSLLIIIKTSRPSMLKISKRYYSIAQTSKYSTFVKKIHSGVSDMCLL